MRLDNNNGSSSNNRNNNVDVDYYLDLSLSTRFHDMFGPAHFYVAYPVAAPARAPLRKRRGRANNQALAPGKPETIEQPYPWATDRRATIRSLRYLRANGISTITGDVQCKRCLRPFQIAYDLNQKLNELQTFMMKNVKMMHYRASEKWMDPTLPDCGYCNQNNCVKPVSSKKKAINWLFLLAGQMLGCCKLAELKYFCKHTGIHRTGAKDRVLFSTYLELCRQLCNN